MNNKQIKKQWLVSYMILLIIPLLFSVVAYIQSLQSLRNLSFHYNDKIIEDAADTVNQELLQLQKFHNNIPLDSLFSKLINEKYVDNDVIYNLNLAKNQMKIMNEGTNTRIFVYLKNIDYTVSTLTIDSLQSFYNSWFKEIYSYEEFTDNLNQLKTKDISVMKNNEGDIVLLQHIMSNAVAVENAYTYFFIQKELFDSMIHTANYDGNKNILVLRSHDDNIVYCSDPDLTDIENNSRYILYSRRCGALTLSYYVDKTMYYGPIKSVAYTIVIDVICCIIAGIVLIWILLRYNYKPISKLIKKAKVSLSQAGENEYVLIEKAFDRITVEQQKMIKVLHKNQSIIKSNLLNNLLLGKKVDESTLDSFEYYDMIKDSRQYAVVICSINDFGILAEDTYWDNRDEVFLIRTGNFSLCNVLCELWSEKGLNVLSTEIDNALVCLVSDQDTHSNVVKLIGEGIAKAGQYMLEYFNISFSAGISGVKTDTGIIDTAYKEAVASLEYCDWTREKQSISYDDLQTEKLNDKYTFTRESKSEFEALVRTGNTAMAQEKINDYLHNYTGTARLSVGTVKIFIYDVMLSLLKMYIEVSDDKDASDAFSQLQKLLNSSMLNHMVAELNYMVQIVCEMYQEKKPGGIIEEIRGYIDENYGSYELNVNQIGAHFKFAPSYISKMFKVACGEDISTYIAKLRMTKSKELLLTTEATIEEIAEKVGFGNTVTFTRNFKKATGMTPGSYRKKNI